MIDLKFSSSLSADATEVWSAVSTMDGVNYELHPFMHMSTAGHEALPTVITPGRVVFRSWLLLFCVLPFDRHALALDRVDEKGFVEESSSWIQRRWRHVRRVTPDGEQGCIITDRLTIETRLRVAERLVAFTTERLFRHRHRRLRHRYAGTAGG